MSREHETLIGPAVIGLVVGVLTALAMFTFESEYNRSAASPESNPWWIIATGHALIGFVVVTLGTILLFGILPLFIRRISAHKSR